jgi:hypothetical protein
MRKEGRNEKAGKKEITRNNTLAPFYNGCPHKAQGLERIVI